jgi:hypothetical protein
MLRFLFVAACVVAGAWAGQEGLAWVGQWLEHPIEVGWRREQLLFVVPTVLAGGLLGGFDGAVHMPKPLNR